MALKKSVSLPQGYTAEYWRVVSVRRQATEENPSPTAVVEISLYKDAAAAAANLQPISTSGRILGSYATFLAEEKNAAARAYELLKATAEFSGAEDA